MGFDFLDRIFHYGHLGVDLFFVLSGFIIFFIHGKDLGEEARLKSYVLKRFFRLFPILFILLIVKTFFGVVLGTDAFTGNRFHPEVILGSFFMVPISTELGGQPLIGVAWTLSHEMLFYAVFGLGILLGRKFLFGFSALWVGAICIQSFVTSETNTAMDFLFRHQNLQFLLGILLCWLYRRSSPQGTPLLVSLFLLLSCLGCVLFLPGRLFNLPHLWSSLIFGLLFVGVLRALLDLEGKGWEPPRFLCFIGDASYSVYLVHSSVQVLFYVVAKKVLGPDFGGGAGAQVALGVMAFASVVGGLVFYLLVEKPLLRVSRNWIRRRS